MARTKTVSAGAGSVQILGLKELRRDLRTWSRKAPRLVSLAHKRLAKKVAAQAKASASAQGSVAGKTAPSIRASGTQTSAAVLLGGPQAPYALGAEFGALQYPQFKPWRGNGPDAGYFLYPTIRKMQREIAETYEDEVLSSLMQINNRVFPL